MCGRAMEKALACLLLALLLSPGGATVKKTLCRVWKPELKHYLAVFSCPQRNDPRDAVFCCGTCSSPRCCSSEVDRLDQRRCHASLRTITSTTTTTTTTTPPPVALPHDWYIMCFLLGVVMIAVTYLCANVCSIHLWGCLRRASRCLRRSCGRRPRSLVQMVSGQMGSVPTLSVIDTCPSSTCASMCTVSTFPEELDEAPLLSSAWGAIPICGCLRTKTIPENDAVILSPAALQSTSVSCDDLKAALAMENPGARQ